MNRKVVKRLRDNYELNKVTGKKKKVTEGEMRKVVGKKKKVEGR